MIISVLRNTKIILLVIAASSSARLCLSVLLDTSSVSAGPEYLRIFVTHLAFVDEEQCHQVRTRRVFCAVLCPLITQRLYAVL